MANGSKLLEPEQIEHPKVAYERRDLSHRAVFAFFLTLACAGFVIEVGIWGIFRQLGKPEYADHQTTNPMETSDEELKEIGGDPTRSFPMPRLQPDPVADLNKFRIQQEDRLSSYGWIDPQAKKIHIPIERTIDILGSSWPQDQQESSAAEDSSTGTGIGPGIKDERKGNYGW